MSNYMAIYRSVCVVCAVILAGAWRTDAQNVSATWLGTQNAYWTNGLNWTGGQMAFGYATATFDDSCKNANTNVSLALSNERMVIMERMRFTSPDCPPYKIGISPDERYVITTAGRITVEEDVINDQTIGGWVRLGNQDIQSWIRFQNYSPHATLRFLGDLRRDTFYKAGVGEVPSVNPVTVYLEGGGAMVFNGNCITNGYARIRLFNQNDGPVTLGGMNRISFLSTHLDLHTRTAAGTSHLTIGEGAELFIDTSTVDYSIWHEGTGIIDGPGALRFGANPDISAATIYVKIGSTLTIRAPFTAPGGLDMRHSTGGGTLVFDCVNTMAGDLEISSYYGTVSFSKMGNKGAADSNLGRGSSIRLTGPGVGLTYTGAGETSDRAIMFTQNAVLDQSGTGDLILADVSAVGPTNKTLTLKGNGTGAGEISSAIGPGTGGTTSLAKEGAGLWRLTAANTFTGTTTVRDGTLTLCGANGALSATSKVTLEGGTLRLSNTVAANSADRLRNAAGVTLNGGCFEFVNDGGVANYSETLGVLTVSGAANVIKATPAAVGQASALTFASLTRSGDAFVDFQGEGLGEAGSTRNRILFTTPPQTVNGYIGPWATVNGTAQAKYDSVRGVYADPTEIAARGPGSVIPDNASADVQITTPGTSGPITLAAQTTGIYDLTQASGTPATVSMPGQTLATYAVRIAEGGASLTLGETSGQGEVTKGTTGAEILFDNRSSQPLTVNAQLNDAGTDTLLHKHGSGTVNLNGRVTVAGITRVSEGELAFGPLAAGSTHTIGRHFVMAGGEETPVTARINGASQASTSDGQFWVSTNAGDRCVLVLDGDLTVAGKHILVGGELDASGAVILRSGLFSVNSCMRSHEYYIGNKGGYGYHRILGGELRNGKLSVGGANTLNYVKNIGVMDMFGGKVTVDDWGLFVGRGRGAGALNIFSGSYGGGNSGGIITMAYNNGGITAQVNLLGPDAKLFDRGASSYHKSIELSFGTGNDLSVVNLNNGEMTLDAAYAKYDTTPTHFNFNGGLLKPFRDASRLLNGTLTAAYVRERGARIDTAGHSPKMAQPLIAPTDYGVSAIALASGGSGYIGAPGVLVSGGTGVGATAIALVDLEPESALCGQVTNILVTSAGSGYAAGDQLSVTLHGGGCLTPAVAGQVTLTENVCGGLTKLGNGTLTLSGASTFTGGTTVSGGTLKFGCADALLPGSAVTVEAAGTLDLGGFTATNTVSGSGTVVNGTLYMEFSPGGTSVIGTQLTTLGQGAALEGVYLLDVALDGTCDKLTLNGAVELSDLTLQVVDVTRLNRDKHYVIAQVSPQATGVFSASNLPEGWRLQRTEDGTFRLYYSGGTFIMVK